MAMNEPAIKKALKAEEIFLKRDKERYLYEMREKALHDHVSAISSAKEEGLEEGLRKGRVEANCETVVRLLAMGLSVAEVSAGTGLPIEEVEKLKQN
ncbi:MAG: nuclease family transposase [Firmicutes bacterium]|nr:nuclease family transposase [Bacillota bacterium]